MCSYQSIHLLSRSYVVPELKMVHPNCTMIEDPSIWLSSVLPPDHCIEEIEEKWLSRRRFIVEWFRNSISSLAA